jgi:hypothetical protein
MRPSKQRQKEDLELVIAAMRKNNFQPYEEKLNPFTEGVRKERFERYYHREHRSFIIADNNWKDLCEVYGYPYETPKL